MGFVPEKKQRYDDLCKTVKDFADNITDVMGEEGFVELSYEEGFEEDPMAMIFIDIPSFSTFSLTGKKLLEEIIHKADAVNFFVTGDKWVRITLGVENEWEKESKPYRTVVKELKQK